MIHHHHHHHHVHRIAPAPSVPHFYPTEPGEAPGEAVVSIRETDQDGPEIEWAERPATPQEIEQEEIEFETEA